MSDVPQKPEPPSPLLFLAEVFYGAMMGFLPAFLIFLSFKAGSTNALGMVAIILFFGALYHLAGWVFIKAPFHLLRWRWLAGHPNPESASPAQSAPLRHWAKGAGFWSSFALINLVMLRAGLTMSEGLS